MKRFILMRRFAEPTNLAMAICVIVGIVIVSLIVGMFVFHINPIFSIIAIGVYVQASILLPSLKNETSKCIDFISESDTLDIITELFKTDPTILRIALSTFAKFADDIPQDVYMNSEKMLNYLKEIDVRKCISKKDRIYIISKSMSEIAKKHTNLSWFQKNTIIDFLYSKSVFSVNLLTSEYYANTNALWAEGLAEE